MAIGYLCDCCNAFLPERRVDQPQLVEHQQNQDVAEDENLLKVAMIVSHIFIVYVAINVAPLHFGVSFVLGGLYGYCEPNNPQGVDERGGSLFQRFTNIHFHPALDVAIATLAAAEHMAHHIHDTNDYVLSFLSHVHLSVLLTGFCTGAQLSRAFFSPQIIREPLGNVENLQADPPRNNDNGLGSRPPLVREEPEIVVDSLHVQAHERMEQLD